MKIWFAIRIWKLVLELRTQGNGSNAKPAEEPVEEVVTAEPARAPEKQESEPVEKPTKTKKQKLDVKIETEEEKSEKKAPARRTRKTKSSK